MKRDEFAQAKRRSSKNVNECWWSNPFFRCFCFLLRNVCECVCIFPCARDRTQTELGCRLVRLLRQCGSIKRLRRQKYCTKTLAWVSNERTSTAFSCVLFSPIKCFLLRLLNGEKARLDDVDERIFSLESSQVRVQKALHEK